MLTGRKNFFHWSDQWKWLFVIWQFLLSAIKVCFFCYIQSLFLFCDFPAAWEESNLSCCEACVQLVCTSTQQSCCFLVWHNTPLKGSINDLEDSYIGIKWWCLLPKFGTGKKLILFEMPGLGPLAKFQTCRFLLLLRRKESQSHNCFRTGHFHCCLSTSTYCPHKYTANTPHIHQTCRNWEQQHLAPYKCISSIFSGKIS